MSHLHSYDQGALPRKPGGYQHRRAHGDSSSNARVLRSPEAQTRRYQRWVAGRRQARQNYREWRSSNKDSDLRVRGGQNPLLPIHPKPTYVERHKKRIKQSSLQSPIHPINHSRSATSPLTNPLPTSTHIRWMSWNIQGLCDVSI